MDFFEEISNILPVDSSFLPVVEDKYTSFRIEYHIISIQEITRNSINALISLIPKIDRFTLSIKIGEELYSIQDETQTDNFIQNVNNKVPYIEDEQIKLIFNCYKNASTGQRHIYNYNSFLEYWSSTEPTVILNLLQKDLKEFGFIFFKFLQGGLEEFGTKNLFWGYTLPEFRDKYTYYPSKENCHFANYDVYPFDPRCFYLTSNSPKNQITICLRQYQVLFCISSIFDITSINDRIFYYKINGYKTFEGNINISDFPTESFDVYCKIFEWIYSADGNVSDKIGLTRNILSIYLENTSINIPEECYTSLLSSFKTYLKENVVRYIELRHKLIDELSWISQKSSEIVEKYLSNFSKTLFTFLSFYISVFIVRFLQSGEFTGVFTFELTMLSYAFLLVSLVFLIVSLYNLRKEKERLKRKYANIKNRFKSFLNPEDIDKILNHDEEFNYEIEFITKRQHSYTWLWALTIVSFAICISILYSKYVIAVAASDLFVIISHL